MPQNHLLRPTEIQLLDAHTDITEPGLPVQIVTDARGVLWLNVGGVCVTRICRMSSLSIEVDDLDIVTRQFTPFPVQLPVTDGNRACAAHTSFPNTPESDRQRCVMHDVTVRTEDGKEETVRLLAEAPDTAIDMVNRMSPALFATLARVAPREI